MRTEPNAWNVGGDLYKPRCVLEKIKAANESLLVKIQYLSSTNTGEDGQAEENTKDCFFLNDAYVEEEEVKELEGHTSASSPPVAHNTVNHIKGLNI